MFYALQFYLFAKYIPCQVSEFPILRVFNKLPILNMMKQTILFLFASSLVLIACESERNTDQYTDEEFELIRAELDLPKEVADYELQLGEYLLEPGTIFPTFQESSLGAKQRNNNKATLGRVLFYDQNLSQDRSVSCGSCHQADHAFSDTQQFSTGVDGVTTRRNSLALATTLSFKISYNPLDASLPTALFSWDHSAKSLDQQVALAFTNENEMNIDDALMMDRLEEKEFYPILFEKAYGDAAMTPIRMQSAIVEFINSISSVTSKFDAGLEKVPYFSADANFGNFTESEQLGKQLYNTNCASCHSKKHNFAVKASANNGLQMVYEDKGIGGRLNRPSDYGVFKVPFLRNVEVTGPYMHDGRFATLEQVVDHYSDGLVSHPNLASELKNEDGSPKRLHLSDSEKEALVNYLKTLTDYKLMRDPRFTDPFES